MIHHAWHASDGRRFYIALDPNGVVLSAYTTDDQALPGVPVEWYGCDQLDEMTADMRAGGWHPMDGGQQVDWPAGGGDPS